MDFALRAGLVLAVRTHELAATQRRARVRSISGSPHVRDRFFLCGVNAHCEAASCPVMPLSPLDDDGSCAAPRPLTCVFSTNETACARGEAHCRWLEKQARLRARKAVAGHAEQPAAAQRRAVPGLPQQRLAESALQRQHRARPAPPKEALLPARAARLRLGRS